MKYKFRVTCDAPLSGSYGAKAPCTFDGYRQAETEEEAGAKPCPRCGGPVQVTPRNTQHRWEDDGGRVS